MITKSTYQTFLPANQLSAIQNIALIEKIEKQDKPDLMTAIENLTFAINTAVSATAETDDFSPLYSLQQVISDLITLEKFAKQTLSSALNLRAEVNAWTDGVYEMKETYSNRKVDTAKFKKKFPDQYNTLLLTEIEHFQAEFKPNVTNTKTVLNSRQQNEVFYQEVNGYELIKIGGVRHLSH